MLAKIEGDAVPAEALWWPAMNFGQFRWEAPLGQYELELPRVELVERLAATYEQCVRELKEDDRRIPEEASRLRDLGYPPLDALLDNPAACLEVLGEYLVEDLLAAFIPHPPSEAARFMINSVDEVSARADVVVVRGRGYHGAPGFAVRTVDHR